MKRKIIPTILLTIVAIFITITVIVPIAQDIKYGAKSTYRQYLWQNVVCDKTLPKEERLGALKFIIVPNPFYDNSSRIRQANKELKGNMEAYNTIVDLLIKVIDDHPEKERMVLSFNINEDETKLWIIGEENGQLNIAYETAQALQDIKASFDNQGYYLDAIRVQKGTISFDTIDGQYSLIYKLDEDTELNDVFKLDEGMAFIKSSNRKWYHLMMYY